MNASFRYRAYGAIAQWNGASAPTYFGYAGQLLDGSGVYYMRARWYDPVSVRFVSRDPLAGDESAPTTLNVFAYAAANPLLAIDPTGLRPFVDSCAHFELACGEGDEKVGTACSIFGAGSDVTGCNKDTVTNPAAETFLVIVPTPGGFAVVAGPRVDALLGGGGGGGGGGGFNKHVTDQLAKRGWTRESVLKTIANFVSTRASRDTRFNPLTGIKNDDPATIYFNADGSYVVRNDNTGDIVQISNRNDPGWRAPK